MVDVTQAAQAKSDQLNAVDIQGVEPIITVRDVQVRIGEQSSISIYFHGDNNRPWKPSKGMIRILIAGWGKESDNWIGKSAQIFMEPSVVYAGKEVGGIQIRAMSDIQQNGMMCILTINRKKRVPFPVKYLSMEMAPYPDDKFNAAFGAISAKLASGNMSIEQVVAQCQKTGALTQEQLSRLQQAAPVVVDEHHD
jgi:hypothetical protein